MEDYATLLEAAKQNPADADFGRLRMAYTETGTYDPFYLPAKKYGGICDLLENDDAGSALELVSSVLETCYLDIQSHTLASIAHARLGNTEMAQYHKRFAVGLLFSIFDSGDGASFETAFVVVSLPEEMAILDALNAQVINEETVEHDGHHFNLVTVRFLSTQEEAVIFFNIDALARAIRRHRPPEAR